MRSLIILSLFLFFSCSKHETLKKENEALKTDTMLQNKTINRLFTEKDSLEQKILIDSLKNIK